MIRTDTDITRSFGDTAFKCILCGGTEYGIVKDVLRGGVTDTKAVRCKVCGLQQLCPLPSIEDDKEFYDKNEHDKTIRSCTNRLKSF